MEVNLKQQKIQLKSLGYKAIAFCLLKVSI